MLSLDIALAAFAVAHRALCAADDAGGPWYEAQLAYGAADVALRRAARGVRRVDPRVARVDALVRADRACQRHSGLESFPAADRRRRAAGDAVAALAVGS